MGPQEKQFAISRFSTYSGVAARQSGWAGYS
jgi:hypothetical protein